MWPSLTRNQYLMQAVHGYSSPDMTNDSSQGSAQPATAGMSQEAVRSTIVDSMVASQHLARLLEGRAGFREANAQQWFPPGAASFVTGMGGAPASRWPLTLPERAIPQATVSNVQSALDAALEISWRQELHAQLTQQAEASVTAIVRSAPALLPANSRSLQLELALAAWDNSTVNKASTKIMKDLSKGVDPLHLKKQSFPEKVYFMLQEVKGQSADAVSYVADGTAFMIHKPCIFETDVMPMYFSSTRMSSFQRQLNIYGFQRIEKGPSQGAYRHKYFIKGQKELLQKIKRPSKKGSS
jgi:hypothetical protein